MSLPPFEMSRTMGITTRTDEETLRIEQANRLGESVDDEATAAPMPRPKYSRKVSEYMIDEETGVIERTDYKAPRLAPGLNAVPSSWLRFFCNLANRSICTRGYQDLKTWHSENPGPWEVR